MDDPVANARLLSLTIERFKSYKDATTIDLSPLTVILGRNNSGKSSIIQALLLLKQTLALPRPEVPLHLEGYVDALNLREITYGRPTPGPDVPGPRITVCWSSDGKPASLSARYAEMSGRVVLKEVILSAYGDAERWTADDPEHRVQILRQPDGQYALMGAGKPDPILAIKMEHFIPYLGLRSKSLSGLQPHEVSHYLPIKRAFDGSLEDLRALLSRFTYLGAMRMPPLALHRFSTVPPEDLGVSGEYAAQMLQARKGDEVHYPLPLRVTDSEVDVPDQIRARKLTEAVNDILDGLGIGASLEIDERDVGFRLLFDKASLQHVGRGISYLLPVIELGLLSDPLRFKPDVGDLSLSAYEDACPYQMHCALEEPEAHLHPKVQTRLAHWLVALAMARRQLLVETHSDHLVRRLRGLVARAKSGSELEAWLLANVRVLHVEQQPDGASIVRSESLTPQGGLEEWPADFMDEATDEERAIYDASLDKPSEPAALLSEADAGEIEHDVGEEPDVGS